ncbi:hypothetical protein RCL1_001596 [Eukaryota sp. TZLM3-RCL]
MNGKWKIIHFPLSSHSSFVFMSFFEGNNLARQLIESGVTYEEYLDSQISEHDLFYLDSQDLARNLVELGFKGSGDTLSREDFEQKKREIEEGLKNRRKAQEERLESDGFNLTDFPLMNILAKFERLVRSGKLAIIIFIRDRNSKGQEVSGYIDYADRLRTDNFADYFNPDSPVRLLPRHTDLSYYNWETRTVAGQNSPNFEVATDPVLGLLFKNKRDRRVIRADPSPESDVGDRYIVNTHEYEQVIIYEHRTRR